MARLGRGQPNRPIIVTGSRIGARTGAVTLAAPSGTLVGRKAAAGTASASLSAPSGAMVGSKATAGALSASLSLTITGLMAGLKSTGIGALPRVRVRWQFIVGPASGGYSHSLTTATERKVTFRLTEPTDAGFKLDGRHPLAEQVDELQTDLHVLWTSDAGNTSELARMRVGMSGDDLTEDAHDVTFTGLDYRALLLRRQLYTGATMTYTGVDQSAIAWALLSYTQSTLGGNLGISRGIGETTGVNQTVTYAAGDKIGERIQELADSVNGFEWDISPVSPSAMSFDVYYPMRGSYKGVVLELGGMAKRIRRTVDPSGYANALRYTGADGLAAVEWEDPNIATLPEGRWDALFGDTELNTQAMLDARAAWQQTQSEVITPVYVITLTRGAWKGPDHIWLGDGVRIIPRSGRLRRVDTVLRVFELSVTIDDDGGEEIEITVGGPKPNYLKRASLVERRLTSLERR